ncbi:MAG: STAS domain-containing protein [Candidatus Omnitrophota bacterium]
MTSIKIRSVGSVSILHIYGTIDINASQIIEAVGWLVNKERRNILINLSSVKKIDHSGLSILAIAYKNVVNHKGVMKFAHVSPNTKDLFRLVRLDAIFDVHENEEAALLSFENRSNIDSLRLRRRFARIDIHCRALYRLSKPRGKQVRFMCDALNVSASGAFLYTPDTFPVGTALVTELALPTLAKLLSVNSMVIWLADKELQPHSYPGMGIMFVRLSSAAEKKIVAFTEKNVTSRAG